MTVGEGILWSTVLIIVFVSIVLLTKHGRWKTFAKVLGIALVLGVLIGAGTWFYFKYQNRPQVVSSLNGINLGMSEVDVTLVKGAADRVLNPDQTPDGSRKTLVYEGSLDSYTYAILRGSKEGMVVTDICDMGGYGRVLGFGTYSSEEDVVEKLGEPSNVSINEKGTRKLLSYPHWNAAFEIEKSDVSKVLRNQPSANALLRRILRYRRRKRKQRVNSESSRLPSIRGQTTIKGGFAQKLAPSCPRNCSLSPV